MPPETPDPTQTPFYKVQQQRASHAGLLTNHLFNSLLGSLFAVILINSREKGDAVLNYSTVVHLSAVTTADVSV